MSMGIIACLVVGRQSSVILEVPEMDSHFLWLSWLLAEQLVLIMKNQCEMIHLTIVLSTLKQKVTRLRGAKATTVTLGIQYLRYFTFWAGTYVCKEVVVPI
ncbi:hypothetical protein F5X98DRAFT_288778 [Xylaria grammica]|nr:hypothetical protein F5X98DRAFT_288778 [Xylaria grammica]